MDYEQTQPPREDLLGDLIENLVQAESSLLSARAMLLESSVAQRSGYEDMAEHISGALGEAQTALAELHHKFHESS